MKALLISFAVGTLVGILYGVIRVKSPAPPIIALVGLLGIVLGEQGGAWLLAKRFKLQTWLQLTLPAYAKIRSNIRASIPR